MYATSQAGTLKQMKHDDLRVKTSEQIRVGFVSYNFNNHPVSVSPSVFMPQCLCVCVGHTSAVGPVQVC